MVSILVIIVLSIIGLVIAFVIFMAIASRMKGKIEIIPDKYNYSPGEEIKGRVILKLKKPVEANKLTIGLVGHREEKVYRNGKNGTETRTVFSFYQPLDGKKDYPASEQTYEFSMKVPSDIQKKTEGALGTVLNTLSSIGMGPNPIRWYLTADLDCKGIDLFKKVQVNIA